jgi:hypothetical protein
MGGGGGGGQQNDAVATPGGNGGGIILIRADQILTSGTCGGRIISANGTAPTTSGNDGAGGGGAGGSIVLDVNSYSIVPTCALSVQASGGNGGSTVHVDVHGGGGGGGQGRVIYSITQPTTNVTTVTNNGSGGCNNTGCASSAAPASGSSGTGISGNSGATPLPVHLQRFHAQYHDEKSVVEIRWTTTMEKDHDYFILEKSSDGISFFPMETFQAEGNSFNLKNYEATDSELWNGLIFYRLKQIDIDQTTTYSKIISVKIDSKIKTSVMVYPNPAARNDVVSIKFINANLHTKPVFLAYDRNGISYLITYKEDDQAPGVYHISCENLPTGVNFLRIKSDEFVFVKKLIVLKSEK